MSVVSDSATPRTAAYQAPPSMGFSRQEYWSGLPLPSPLRLLLSRNFAAASVKISDCSLMSTMFAWKKEHEVEKEGTNICTNQPIRRPCDFTWACQRPTPPSYSSTPDIFPVFKIACFPPCWTLTFGCIIVSGWIAPRLACCSPRGHRGSDTTEWLNSTELRDAAKSWHRYFIWRGGREVIVWN